jgi:hypothetical protein
MVTSVLPPWFAALAAAASVGVSPPVGVAARVGITAPEGLQRGQPPGRSPLATHRRPALRALDNRGADDSCRPRPSARPALGKRLYSITEW